MGIGQKFENLAASAKGAAQDTSIRFASLFLRVLTGLVLGYVLGLIAQETMEFGNLVLLFFVIAFTAFFYRVSAPWSLFKIFLFDIFCALVLQILKMYILLAP